MGNFQDIAWLFSGKYKEIKMKVPEKITGIN